MVLKKNSHNTMNHKSTPTITAKSHIPVIKKNTVVINKIVISGLAVTVGFALKALVQSFVFDILEPITYIFFSLNKFTSKIVNKNEQKLKFINFMSQLITFIFIILIVLLIIKVYFS
jgi:large-conductance mechanosensitive channel